MVTGYIPKRGDIIWLDFNPQVGHEQRGRRPAIVLSPKAYNQRVGLGLFCPVTNRSKGYPFEVAIPDEYKVTGVILSDHVKNLDWKVRRAEFIAEASEDIVEEVLAKLNTLLT